MYSHSSAGSGYIAPSGHYSTPFNIPLNNVFNKYRIDVTTNYVNYYVNNILIYTINLNIGQMFGTQTTNFGVIGGSKFGDQYQFPTITNFEISAVTVSEKDIDTNKNYNEMSGETMQIITNPSSGGTSSSTNLGTLSFTTLTAFNNTTPISVTFGGMMSGTTSIYNNDCIICAMTQSAGTGKLARSSFITSIYLDCYFVSTTTGTFTFLYTLAYGGTDSNLTTTETATTKAFRYIPLGMQTITSVANTPSYMQNGAIFKQFDTPIVASRYEYICINVKNIGANASQSSIFFNVCINGWFE